MSEIETHPVEEIPGIEPIFVMHMMIGSMASRYMRAASLTPEQGYSAARASWETEWPSDPAPRTFAESVEVVDDDLAYWVEDGDDD